MSKTKTTKAPVGTKLSLDPPQAWEHSEKGEYIEGRIGRVQESSRFPGRLFRIITNEDGSFYLNGSAGLIQIMDEVKVPTGSTLRVVYTGTRKTNYANPMKVYDVFLIGGANGHANDGVSDDLPF